MDATIPIWTYWYFHLPNYFLAALLYTLLGRYLLSMFVPADWNNYIWQGFRRATDWAVRAARHLVPRAVHEGFLPLVAAFWVLALRFVFFLIMVTNGWAPVLRPAGPG